MEGYDEDLGQNVFLRGVAGQHGAVLRRAAADGWLLCVPRAEAAPPLPLDQALVEAHVLVPCPEEPDTRFTTLGGRGVLLQGSTLVLEGQAGGAPRHVRVLFTETFYDEALGRYKALCVEEALTGAAAPPPVTQVSSLRECVELLWARAGGSRGLARLDALLTGFLGAHPQLEEEESVLDLRDLVWEVYCEALQVVREEAGQGETVEAGGVLGLAVESYLLHGLHGKLIRCLASCRAEEDARFNRAVRGLSDLQPSDLGLGPELAGGLVRATLELSGLGSHTTPLGKLGCLKRAVAQLGRETGPVSSDQLLPALVVVVVRTGLPTWPAQLAYLRLFSFSAPAGGGGEQDFYLSSLEAALQHIASGALMGSTCPEADSVLRPGPGPVETMETTAEEAGQDPCTRYFECVRQGLVEEVEALLEGQGRPQRDKGSSENSETQLCHPLCLCERCETLVQQPQEDPWPAVTSEDPLGRTGLHLACIFGRPTMVDLMVGRGAALEARDQRGATPLHHAAQRGHQNALLLLLHAGADINSVDGEQNTALHLAAMQGHPACVKALLFYAESVGRHLEVNGQNAALDTPLHLASRWGHLAIVEQLLDRLVALGLPLNTANRRRLTPIECAHNQFIVRAILAARTRATEPGAAGKPGARLASGAVSPPGTHLEGPVRAPQGRRPLGVSRAASIEKMLKAVRIGDEQLACFYLGIEDCAAAMATPSSVPSASPALCHPLCQCAKCVAKAPTGQAGSRGGAHGVAVNACDSQGRTALHEAVAAGHQELVGLLLRHGADPNAQTLDQGLSPLHLAARGGDSQLLADLAQYGANLDLTDTLGNTALHLSCAAGHSDTTGELLRLGASRGLSNLASRSPTQEAEEHGHWRLVEMLLGKVTSQ